MPCKSSLGDTKNNDYLKMKDNGVVISDTWFLSWIEINKSYTSMHYKNTGNNGIT